MASLAQEKKHVTFFYFGLFAKGPSIALCLHHSGLEWKGASPDRKVMKEEFPFRCVPVLELESGRKLGHELAILSYLARRCPKTAGGGEEDESDWVLQSQLQAACEDLYQKLVRFQSTKYVERDLGKQEANWTANDTTTHNAKFGIPVYLGDIERLLKTYARWKDIAKDGRVTASGVSAGECKLFAVLHIMVMIKGTQFLQDYPIVNGFYNYFHSLDKTKEVLKNGGNFPEGFQFVQYFVSGGKQ